MQSSRLARALALLTTLAGAGIALLVANHAFAAEAVIHRFTAGADGKNPYAGLTFSPADGSLYGTTSAGGAGTGTVFRLSPSGVGWSMSGLYSFKAGADGAVPKAALTFGPKGKLFGTTQSGGTPGEGTVFMLTPTGGGTCGSGGGTFTESVIYTFKGGTDGALPIANVVFDTKGILYGTAQSAGNSAFGGTVFKLTPPVPPATTWTETNLYRFAGGTTDGLHPKAGLVFDSAGALYGTTAAGGTSSNGTIFKLTKPTSGTLWTETTLYNFAGGMDGAVPLASLIFDSNGALYGTTQSGGGSGYGTIFKLIPPAAGATKWTETVLYRFKGGTDGANPEGPLSFGSDGALYGTTTFGATTNFGTIFKLAPPTAAGGVWTESVLYRFQGGTDGDHSVSSIAFGNGVAYGTTVDGGGSPNAGTIFQFQ